jgi:hypothetical protein
MTEDTRAALLKLVRELQAHAREHGWQDCDEPLANILAFDVASPSSPLVAKAVTKAREATATLRDFARQHGMDFRERDPLVMAIHRALDLADPALPREEP